MCCFRLLMNYKSKKKEIFEPASQSLVQISVQCTISSQHKGQKEVKLASFSLENYPHFGLHHFPNHLPQTFS